MPVEVIRGDCFEVCDDRFFKRNEFADLVIVDPPYGGIVNEAWDRDWTADDYRRLTSLIETVLKPHGTAYVWGGIGTFGNRIFFDWLHDLEKHADGMHVHNIITWKKRRAYGKSTDYLFTREECAMLVKGPMPPKPKKLYPATFNVPLLEAKRGYAGYNEKYPAKSEFFRVSNVWDDINEIFRGKIHPCEKPSRLAERMIQTSSRPGDMAVDLMAGSGSTGVAAQKLGRRCVLVEKSDCPMRPLDGAPDPNPPVLIDDRVRYIARSADGRFEAEVLLPDTGIPPIHQLQRALQSVWGVAKVYVGTEDAVAEGGHPPPENLDV